MSSQCMQQCAADAIQKVLTGIACTLWQVQNDDDIGFGLLAQMAKQASGV